MNIFRKFTLYVARQPIKSSDLDKSRMKHGGLLNKHFYKKKSNIPNDLAEIANFHFSHYKSMETLSCHSNQSSYPTKIKKITFVEGNVLSKHAKFFCENSLFMLPRQPIKLSYSDKSLVKVENYLINFSVKIKFYYPL